VATPSIEISGSARDGMRKSMSRNPNMLRTMIGTGLVLVLVLAFAVYSNTVDSEYYGYTTTNEPVDLQVNEEIEGEASWQTTSTGALTWINVTISGAPAGSTLRVEASTVDWYHSPLLGAPDAENFNCGEWSEVTETCALAHTHEVEVADGNATLRGIVSMELPLEGLGYLQSDDLETAQESAQTLIANYDEAIVWTITVFDDDGIAESQGIDVSAVVVSHEIVSVAEFKLDPVQESVYSFATLVGCFSLLLALPLMVYYSAMYKAKRDERIRSEAPEP